MSQERILIVEDDIDSAEVLEAYLQRDGFLTRHALDGKLALDMHARWRPDLVLLDIMLPGLNGHAILSAIRHHSATPVIMVTAVSNDSYCINALLYGADDYIIKPYNPSEVVARVYAVLRRWRGQPLSQAGRLRHGRLVVDLDAALASIDTREGVSIPLDLTRTEFHLLSLLMAAPNKMFSRTALLTTCLPESDAMERVVDTHMHNLRRKLVAAGITGVLLTVRGLGYRFRNPS
ncbi:DNA-binding response regulator [Yersinia pseudotuberculosis]|uniref:CpxR family transcriptional regulator n=1 Tax=Yersinia pseudotuberculosis TaxID=633 RepID=A0A380Q4A9_YERPU|nr:response regulator [Yersinia pseudotuberculosis]PSH24210.1 DNA-binding response regulator [Yersinia pseudotuberculosis]SUP80618.1 CpxR family transcriptional regulator [Yersinia pseudotuberculosis]